jgi:hypothetical protein
MSVVEQAVEHGTDRAAASPSSLPQSSTGRLEVSMVLVTCPLLSFT